MLSCDAVAMKILSVADGVEAAKQNSTTLLSWY